MNGGDDQVLLVLSAQTGDREALEQLLRNLRRPLGAYLVSLLGASSAEDVLQDSLLQIYKKLRWLDEPRAFRAWAYRIATRNAFAALRRERPWREMDRDPATLEAIPAVTPQLDHWEREQSFTDRVAELTPASRVVMVLHYQSELTLAEIAGVLDVPLGTVKSRLAYGINTLRQRIKEKELSHDHATKNPNH